MSEEQVESWKNATEGRFVLQRMTALGQRGFEMIGPNKVFHVTPAERRLNQELAASDELDAFANGMLQPVRLLEETEAEVLTNPNHIAESEVRALFTMHWKTFEKRLQEISNASTLERLLTLAREDEVNATVRQLEAIQARLQEVSPPTFENVEVVTSGASSDPVSIRPVTPR